MTETKRTTLDLSFLFWIFALLVILKVTGVISWSWFVIFIPLYPLFALWLFIAPIMLFAFLQIATGTGGWVRTSRTTWTKTRRY